MNGAPRARARRTFESFDFIVVGAGSAGCALAERLSASGRFTVLVLEAGGSDAGIWIKIPIGYGRTFFDPSVNWRYEAAPDPGLDGRNAYWPRGRVVGGSSSINALVYCRGLPNDFDDWRAAGASGWGFDDVEPIFRRIEGRIDVDSRRQTDGPLAVADVSREVHPLNRHFFAAAAEIGLPRTNDFNGPSPEGVGVYQINRRNGFRCSAADAFLKPALRRGRVRLVANALVTRIVIEEGRATGVEFERGGEAWRAQARAEVIVAAGAVASPQLLQLSGVGPAALLRAHGVPVVVDAPAVGANLQDHLAVTYAFRSREKTLNDELAPFIGRLRAALRYALARRGPLSLSVNQCGGFVRATKASPFPDVQLYFNPLSYSTKPPTRRRSADPDPFPGFILSYQPSRPTSRGRILIASPDPRVHPTIEPNSLSTQKDLKDVVAGGRLLQALVGTSSMQGLIEAPIGPSVVDLDDASLIEDFRKRAATVFHPCGTCGMGESPEASVVDPKLKVFGVKGLRVADASVFPSITSGNTNAPAIMVGFRAGELILEDR